MGPMSYGLALHSLQGGLFQLQFLLYNTDGTLNAVGQQINGLLSAFNAIARLKNGVDFLTFKPLADIVTTGGTDFAFGNNTLGKFSETIDIKQRDMRQRGVTARQGLGASTYAKQNPGSIIVQVSPVTDPTAVAKEIKRVLSLSDRKDGGYGIRMGAGR